MALNPEIALNVRPMQLDNQLANYGKIMQIQNAGNQNRLAEIQYRQALKAEADQNTLRTSLAGVDINTPEGMAQARNALIRMGNIKGAQELDKNALVTQETRGKISKQDADRVYQQLGIVGGALGPLLQNPSRQAIMSTLQSLQAQGIKPPPIPIPADDALLPAWVKQVAALTDKGLKALEAFSPKVSMTNLGATVQPTNTNALAGPVGALPGATPMATTATPGALLADARSRDFNATARAAVDATRDNTQAQRDISNAATIRAEQDKYIKPLDELQQNISSTRQLLATSTPAADIQIQQQLTDMFDRTRATNMLFGANKNFGTLAGRVSGFIGRMFTGQYTDKQRSEIRGMINDMERNVLTPTRKRIEKHYGGISKAAGVNPALTKTPNFYGDAGSAQAEADAFLKGN